MSKVAVVILNYNGEKLLRQFLPSVIQHSTLATVIVADNGSDDESIKLLTSEFPSVALIQLRENFGFCKGYNEALQQVDADIYILLNSDVEVTPHWLEPMLELFECDHHIAAVQPKILSYSLRNKFEYAGAGGGLIDVLGYPFCRGRVFQHIEEDHGQYNDEREVFWASGACIAIRSSVYHQHNGLDEDFFAHMEEIDLCWKIHRTDKKVFYTGKSTVYHLGAGTLSYQSPRKTYLNFRNNLSMLVKHYDSMELLWKFPVRIILDWMAALMFLLKGDAANGGAVLQAHVSIFKNLNILSGKRKALKSAYPTYSRTTIHPDLIILQYLFPKNGQ